MDEMRKRHLNRRPLRLAQPYNAEIIMCSLNTELVYISPAMVGMHYWPILSIRGISSSILFV